MADARGVVDHWVPSSEADIQTAIEDGLLIERYSFDVKREVGSRPGDRKESARDMASFAINGGALLIGVEEVKAERTWELAPQSLDGLAERMEQIAHQAIDPPLFITTTEIPAAAGDGTGYLLVQIPPSGRAPHMVDGLYFARHDKTRHRLTDADVVRLHSARRPLKQLAESALDEEIARDFIPADQRQSGHFYGVAVPVAARREVARKVLERQRSGLLELFESAEDAVPEQVRGWAPGPGYADQFTPRAQGAALVSLAGTGPGRTIHPEMAQGSLVDLELREDGGLRVLMDRATRDWRRSSETTSVVTDGVIVAYAVRLARWAGEVGQQVGYRGQWVLGIHADQLRGLASYVFTEAHERGVAYDAEFYREVTEASYEELVNQPQVVASRLVGRLLRGLGVAPRYEPLLSSPVADRAG